MDMTKLVFAIIGGAVGLALFYAYVKHLFNEGYEEDEIHLHLFHDVPLHLLDRIKSNHNYSSYTPSYKKSPPEHETIEYDSYPSYYGSNCDPEIAALMNAPAADLQHNNKLLSEGGWKCSCGRVHAAYVSSCSCGRNKHGETAPKIAAASHAETETEELKNAAAIREYKKLMDDGIITAEEFEAKKKQLLGL